MDSRRCLSVLILILLLGPFSDAGGSRAAGVGAPSHTLIKQPGSYLSPDGTCRVALSVASMGGFWVLRSGGEARGRLRVDDVNGMAWVGRHTLAYTTSPIYGVPGVYVYACGAPSPKRIVGPRTLSKAYPDGQDYFELHRVTTKEPITLYFYYAPNVDKVDFTKFRTPASLYQVRLDGSNFGRVQNAGR